MKRRRNYILPVLLSVLAVLLFAGCGTDREVQESYRQLGIRQLEDGDYASAVESFQKALDESLGKVGDIEIDICCYKALAQFKDGDIAGAIETYTALLEYDEENADVYFLRGSAYLSDGQYENGISDYDRAAELGEDDYELFAEIYENLCALGYEEKGTTYLNEAVSRECSSAEDYCGQGHLYYLLGDYETAEDLLETAVEEGSDTAVLYLAETRMELGDTESADSLLASYLEEHPDDAEALTQAGVLAANMGEYESAIAIFTQALSLEGEEENASLRLNLVYAYEYSGDFETAYELLLQYAADYPEDDSVEDELTFLETRVAETEDETETESEE